MSFWKKQTCGQRKILRLTTSLTIYRLGLRGNNVHRSTRKHRFWTRKPLKSPEITQKIFAGHFGTLHLQDRIFSPQNPQKSLETSGFLFIRTKNEHWAKADTEQMRLRKKSLRKKFVMTFFYYNKPIFFNNFYDSITAIYRISFVLNFRPKPSSADGCCYW